MTAYFRRSFGTLCHSSLTQPDSFPSEESGPLNAERFVLSPDLGSDKCCGHSKQGLGDR